jgi:hypothetical protein
LLSPRLKPLLLQVTAFTVLLFTLALSITALAAVAHRRAAIALSIVVILKTSSPAS